MNVSEIRRFALSLPEVTEEPHHHFSSFRVRGKIFTTVPPDESHVHVFVDDAERERMTATAPEAYEKLWWGKKVVGLRVTVSKANAADVEELLRSAWLRKASAALIRRLDGGS